MQENIVSGTQILDSGERIEFSTGAKRSPKEGKGRFDYMPIDCMSELFGYFGYVHLSTILQEINEFCIDKNTDHILKVLFVFIRNCIHKSIADAMLEVALHYEQGALVYGPNNWKKGINLHSYIDSGIRHLMQWAAGSTTEPHHRAFIWNMLCAMWTVKHMPELIDL